MIPLLQSARREAAGRRPREPQRRDLVVREDLIGAAAAAVAPVPPPVRQRVALRAAAARRHPGERRGELLAQPAELDCDLDLFPRGLVRAGHGGEAAAQRGDLVRARSRVAQAVDEVARGDQGFHR